MAERRATQIAIFGIKAGYAADLAIGDLIGLIGIISVALVADLGRYADKAAIAEALLDRALQMIGLIFERVATDAGARADIAAKAECDAVGQRGRVIKVGALFAIGLDTDPRDAFLAAEVERLGDEVDRRARAVDGEHTRRTALNRFDPVDRHVGREEFVGAAAAITDRQTVFLELDEGLAATVEAAHRVIVRHRACGPLDEDAGDELKQVGDRLGRLAHDIGLRHQRDVGGGSLQRAVL